MGIAENAAVIVAIVEFIKRYTPANVHGAVTVATAIVVGAALSLAQGDVSLIQGAVNGLVAVGAVTTVSKAS